MAQTKWPEKPITIVVPYSAGGATDAVARIVANALSEAWGQSIIVENRPGGNCNIAANHVARSAADGYTLLATGPWFLINQYVETGRHWEPANFVPVAQIGYTDNILVVPAQSPAKTVQDYVEMAKKSATPLQYGSPGFGSTQRMAAEMFAKAAGIKIQAVQYKGAPPIIPDLIANRLSMSVLASSNVTGLVKAGKLRALATASTKRNPNTPDVPTMVESGYANAVALSWFGFHAPAGTPKAVIDKVDSTLASLLKDQSLIKKLEQSDTRVAFLGAKDWDQALVNEGKQWKAIAASISN